MLAVDHTSCYTLYLLVLFTARFMRLVACTSPGPFMTSIHIFNAND